MCGIFGYVGKNKNTAETVLAGLKLMEYRGYDSWGVAVKDGDTLAVDKHIGKIGNAQVDLPDSTLGIGHTRWATHGGVTDENAHPHLDCTKQIAVVHNGIIENYAGIKEELIKSGHTFISETDTEVIPHLIEENLKSHTFPDSVSEAFNRFTGMNAIVVVNTQSNEIIAAKTGSPLIAGVSDDGLYISSDVAGIISHTRKVIFLKDKEMIVLGEKIQLFGLETGEVKEMHIESVDWKIEDAFIGSYPHFMIKEIHEQPTVIRNIAENYDDQILELSGKIKHAYGTFFIAAGTAYFACLAGTYLFSINAKRHVNAAVASEFNYLEDFLTDKSLIIALSQSGETIDVIEPLQRAKERGSTIVALVNTLGSTLYRMADMKILLGAGPEKAVASTKAYTAKSALLYLVSMALQGDLSAGKAQLLMVADEIERLLGENALSELQNRLAAELSSKEHIYVVGRGMSYSSALEAALKIKEVSYIHTEGLAGGELKHGTIALIEKGTPCIVFAPNDETYDAIMSNAMEIKSRGGYIIGVSSKNSPVFDYWIEVTDLGGATLIAQIIPIQLLAYYLAITKNLDPDKPRNLAKSVTVK
jgi:glutamine---fructose-6-phosphate transaminase (isomerizing)